MEDLGLTATFECHVQGLQATLRVKTADELRAEHAPGEDIDDCRQEEETFRRRDGDAISRQQLNPSCDPGEIHQAEETLGWITRNRGARFLVNPQQKSRRQERCRCPRIS